TNSSVGEGRGKGGGEEQVLSLVFTQTGAPSSEPHFYNTSTSSDSCPSDYGCAGELARRVGGSGPTFYRSGPAGKLSILTDSLTTLIVATQLTPFQDTWMDWSLEVHGILQSMADRLLDLEVPDETMVDLIRIASMYPSKPGIPEESERRRGLVPAEADAPLYNVMAGILANRPSAQVRYTDPVGDEERGVENIGLSKLSITAQDLSRYNLRKLFRNMLESDSAPNTGLDAQRQLMAFLDTIFEAEKEAVDMTDEEAEMFVDMMNAMDLDGQPGLRRRN
ncbi:MAG: hypothetical protein Q9163_005852, partial [Psora crenata]